MAGIAHTGDPSSNGKLDAHPLVFVALRRGNSDRALDRVGPVGSIGCEWSAESDYGSAVSNAKGGPGAAGKAWGPSVERRLSRICVRPAPTRCRRSPRQSCGSERAAGRARSRESARGRNLILDQLFCVLLRLCSKLVRRSASAVSKRPSAAANPRVLANEVVQPCAQRSRRPSGNHRCSDRLRASACGCVGVR